MPSEQFSRLRIIRPVPCEKCGKEFIGRTAMRKHKEEEHAY